MTLISITRRASDKLINMLRKQSTPTAIFYVKGGGCNGLKYKLEPTTEPENSLDITVPLDTDYQLRVCGKSAVYVAGTEIDWQDDFMGQQFVFQNPNTAGTCGCGATFTPQIE